MHELILGGQKSGKSRCAEQRVAAWLAAPGHRAVLLATAREDDAEMSQRIARHRSQRAVRVPGLATVEVPLELARAVAEHSGPECMVVVDCLLLWLVNLIMPLDGSAPGPLDPLPACEGLCEVLRAAAGPVVLVSNEIGLGVSPMSFEARHFVDVLGGLHQALAALCTRVTLMVAGIEVVVKPVTGAVR